MYYGNDMYVLFVRFKEKYSEKLNELFIAITQMLLDNYSFKHFEYECQSIYTSNKLETQCYLSHDWRINNCNKIENASMILRPRSYFFNYKFD